MTWNLPGRGRIGKHFLTLAIDLSLRRSGLAWLVALIVAVFPPTSRAQVPTHIISSGLGTKVGEPRVSGTETVHDITGGTRPGGGPSLFHSFGRFDVGPDAGHVANFLNDSGVATSNILARVTGRQVSQLYGTIRTTDFGAANLFLINPSGFVFGPGATLNVSGAFHTSTANDVRLFDGTNSAQFYTDPANDTLSNSVLSVTPLVQFGFLAPAAYGFSNSSAPAGITVEGSVLSVDPGNTLALVAGNIVMKGGKVSAPSGQTLLASVASPGEMRLSSLEPAPNVEGVSFSALGNITLSQGAVVDVSGSPGGTIRIRGGRFVMEASTISNLSSGDDASGDIALTAESVNVGGGARITALGTGSGRAGGITLAASNLLALTGNTKLSSDTRGPGQGGTITLTAGERITVIDSTLATTSGLSAFKAAGDAGRIQLTAPTIDLQGSLLAASTVGPGNGGDITLAGDRISLATSPSTAALQIGTDLSAFTNASGHAGSIALHGLRGPDSPAEEVELSSFSRVFSETRGQFGDEGPAGDILIEAYRLVMTGNSSLSSSSQGQSAGAAGSITINASKQLRVSSESSVRSESFDFASGDGGQIIITSPSVIVEGDALISTSTDFLGEAGMIEVNAGTLQLRAGGQIKSSSVFSNPDFPEFLPTGAAGSVAVQGLRGQGSMANMVVIEGADSSVLTTTEGEGAGGNITLMAKVITLQDGGTLSAASSGVVADATGGAIDVTARQTLSLINSAQVSSRSTGPANAGNITLTAGDSLLLSDSQVTSEASQASGGNIKLTTADLLHVTDGQITASVQGSVETVGGNITIDPQFVVLRNSQILATAVQGQGGNITIIGNVVLIDPASVLDASSALGISGSVQILAPVQNVSSALAPLPKDFASAAALLGQRCVARVAKARFSTFVVAGRDSVPPEPGGLLQAPAAQTEPVVAAVSGRAQPGVALLTGIGSPGPGTAAVRLQAVDGSCKP